MAIKLLKEHNLTWVNIDQVDAEAMKYLKTNFSFHPLDLGDVEAENITPKIDSYKNYIFVVLQFPYWNEAEQSIMRHEIDMFISDNYLITIQFTKSKEIKNFFYRCMKNKNVKREWMSKNPGFLLYKLIEALFRNTQPMLDNIGKKLSNVEDNIFAGEQNRHIVRELAALRRSILQFRRILDPQRYLIATLSHTRRTFLDESLALYFDDVTDNLNKLWAITDTYRDTGDGLHVTIESVLTHRTNKVISALTTISVSLLPLTLLSGIYGMNIEGLPFADKPGFVWTMFVLLLATVLGVIVWMRKKRWL